MVFGCILSCFNSLGCILSCFNSLGMFPLEIPLGVSPTPSIVVTGTDQDNNTVVIGRADVTLPGTYA